MRKKFFTKNNILRIVAVVALAVTALFITLSVVEGNATKVPQSDLDNLNGLSVSALYRSDDKTIVGTDNGKVTVLDDGGEVLWEYSKENYSAIVRAVAIRGSRAYAAFGDRRIAVFDSIDGSALGWFTVGLEPYSFRFGTGNVFAVYCNTNQTLGVYFFDATCGGSEDNPVRYNRSCMLDRNGALSDGYGDMLITDDAVYVASQIASVITVPLEGTYADSDGITEVWRGDDNLLAVMQTSDGFAALDEYGRVIRFNGSFEEVKTYGGGTRLTAALVSDNVFVAKCADGKIAGYSDFGEKRFEIKSGRESLLIYASPNSFAYLTEDGGKLVSVETKQAVRMELAATLFPLFIVLSCVFALACVFTALCGFTVTRNALKSFFGKTGRILWRHKFSYLALIPTFVLLGLFYYYPIIWGFGLSFFNYTPGESAVFVGLGNIIAVIKNTAFWTSFLNMLVLLVTDIIKSVVPPLIFAECILSVKSKKFSFWVRALLFIPGILPGVAGTLVWAEGVFGSGASGLLNGALKAIFPSYITQSWLQQESTALTSLIFFGFPWIGSYLIFYGAITGIPPSIYEAARLDGCGRLKRIVKFDIPLILPQIKYVFITGFIASVQDYGRILITTRGDFGTNTPSLMMYLAITDQKNYGIASAMSLFLFAFLVIVTILNFRSQTRKSEE